MYLPVDEYTCNVYVDMYTLKTGITYLLLALTFSYDF